MKDTVDICEKLKGNLCTHQVEFEDKNAYSRQEINF